MSHIITFGTLAAKQAVKDVARVYNVPAKEANAITKTMPSAPGMTISRALKESPEFADIIKNNSLYEKVVRIAQKVEGLPRQTGVHACGIILSQKPVDEYCPTAKVKDDNGEYFTTTQFEGPECEEVGLIKFDFLGLRTLDVLDISLELIKEEKSEFNMLPENIPIDDIETYMFLKEGNTDGVFQFESDGMTSLVKQMFSDVKPDDSKEKGEEYFERLIAAVALYRPGPMDEIPNYLKAIKSGNIIYDHPKLKSILSPTYGIFVYQEEIMMAVRELAGFSKGDSDKVRKGIGKKKIEIMNEYGEYFVYGSEKHDKEKPEEPKNIPGCIKNGISEATAKMIWEKMVKFASYAFNKSHATCYGALGARTAYLACHYPIEYTTGILNSYLGNNEKISYYVGKCRRKGINLLAPDVNNSDIEFKVINNGESKSIIFGLSGIKGVGSVAAEAIVNERKQNGPYKNIEDFLVRTAETKVDKSCLEALCYTGAFDSFKQGNRRVLIETIPDMISLVKSVKKKNKNQMSLFEDMFGDESAEYTLSIRQNLRDYSPVDKAIKEEEYLGYFVKHPMTAYSNKLDAWRKKEFLSDISEVLQEIDDSINKVYRKRIAGIVKDKKMVAYTDRKGKPKQLLTFRLNDETGTVKCVGFDDIAAKYGHLINENSIVYVLCDGKKDDFGPSCEIRAIHIFSEEEKNVEN